MHMAYKEGMFYRWVNEDESLSATSSDMSAVHAVLPRVFYSYGSAWTGDFFIVMEDLSASCILASRLLGNQCWGPVDIPQEVEQNPVVILETIFVGIADMHAKYWRDRGLLDQPWLKNVDWAKGKARGVWERSILSSDQKFRRIFAAIDQNSTSVAWDPIVIRAMHLAIEATSWAKFQEFLDVENPLTAFTLCHGDFHAGNVLWNKSYKLDVHGQPPQFPPFYLVDWMVAGVFSPFTDIAQFMISNATTDLRRRHEEALFKVYHTRLVIGGVDESLFPLDACFERYKAGGVERWLQMLALLAVIAFDSPQKLPESAIQWFHDQVCAFVQDHASKHGQPALDFALMTAYA